MDYDDFTAFEHRGWEHIVQPYESYFGYLTAQSHGALLDALEVGAGTRMLDVATGPGNLAAAALERGATLSAVDFSAAMIAHARQSHPDVEFQVASAESLPFEDESFDAVGISFGMLHFPHPEAALAEAARVLRKGGRVAFTVWAAPKRAVGFQMVLDAVQQHGRLDVALPAAPPFFRFSDADESKRVLAEAGFADPQAVEVDQTWHLAPPETPFHGLLRGGVRMGALLRAQEPSALARIEKEVKARAAAYLRDGQLLVPMPCMLASAIKR
ncbi:methyltransferase type 11 [Caballeronia arationis]|jgi:ubiquinone/menaquinone biosynthesis C-methylase UbiE|uniref:Ubiquinone/menaquinone biosynthesis C-methylase UbiE n=1 Tax=Caballeronia arationis TaxID=1777142 RepID=A0A7Z7N6K9_9BURK|nr:methyltransferase domain-containing protein [Caballeronia arationis]SAK73017.1 methyltransferase type 11 [Caballeronia arationis]SOE88184.1 Ubiquinone/menaquinone biosynthesis C-methylase UbiE [Caballeronia arationis]